MVRKLKNSWFSKVVLFSAVCLTVLICLSATVRAEKVNFQEVETITGVPSSTCDPTTGLPQSGDPVCLITVVLTDVFSGDLVGTGLGYGLVLIYPNGSALFTIDTTITGTISGHGSGSFAISEYDGVINTDGTSFEKWQVVPKSGNGDFVGITGAGRQNASGPAGNVIGTYVGTLQVGH